MPNPPLSQLQPQPHLPAPPPEHAKTDTAKTRSCNVATKSAASPSLGNGVVAQLVERLVRNEKVRGSNPLGSTTSQVYQRSFSTHPGLQPTLLQRTSPLLLRPTAISHANNKERPRASLSETRKTGVERSLDPPSSDQTFRPLSWPPSPRCASPAAAAKSPHSDCWSSCKCPWPSWGKR